MTSLRLIDDEGQPGRSFSLSMSPFSIGRDPSNSLPLNDIEVAARHCEIVREMEGVFLLDTGSSSGTFVNGQMVRRSRLSGGDRIRVGKTELMLELVPGHPSVDDSGVWNLQERKFAVGETAVLMSHHINNILQGISGGSHLIDVGIKNRDLSMVAKGWESVGRKQSELSDLILDLLRLGKPFRPIKSRVDLVEVTQAALSQLSEESRFDAVTIRVADEPGSLPTRADDEALRFAIGSLICAAAKASCTTQAPALEIGFEKSEIGSSIRIEYRGGAIWIDPEESSIPVGPMESAVGAIEFATCRRIIREHRGDIVLTKIADLTNCILVTLPDDPGDAGSR